MIWARRSTTSVAFWCGTWLSMLVLISATATAQLDRLRATIPPIARSIDGIVGVAVIDLATGDTVTFNGDARLPMQSVYKLPIALAVLDGVQDGRFALEQVVHVTAADLLPNTWSPLRDAHPAGGADLPLDSILTATVALSDNNGCDILLRLIGGPAVADAYLRRHGIEGMAIVATEEAMHQDDSVQYRNFSTPFAMAQLLQRFATGALLHDRLSTYLWTIMVQSPTGARRLKGLLPAGTVVAHKTGSSGTDARGITAATNDAGVIVLPDGRKVAVAVFVSNTSAPAHRREEIIARVARSVWDVYQP